MHCNASKNLFHLQNEWATDKNVCRLFSCEEKFLQWAHSVRHLTDEKKMKQTMKRIIVLRPRQFSKESPSAAMLQRGGIAVEQCAVFRGYHAIVMDDAADDAIVHR